VRAFYAQLDIDSDARPLAEALVRAGCATVIHEGDLYVVSPLDAADENHEAAGSELLFFIRAWLGEDDAERVRLVSGRVVDVPDVILHNGTPR
jgi:hypothetical protein